MALALNGCAPAAAPAGNGFNVNFSSLDSNVSVEQNVAYGTGAYRMLDIYTPSNPLPDRPVLIFFHGGLWQNSDKKEYGFIGQAMAQRGVLTVVANYSLYPKATFPEFLSDGANAVAWTRENIAAYGGNPRRVFLMGHTAGAYIAAMLALDPEYLAKEGLTQSSVVGMIGIAGLYNLLPLNGKSYAGAFVNFTPPENIEPAHYTPGAAPPMLLLSGKSDEMISANDTTALAAHVKETGGKIKVSLYPQVGHLGLVMPFSPAFHGSTEIVDEIVSFIVNPQAALSAGSR